MILSVYLIMLLYILILFRIDKNINNKNQFIEISIINWNLTASENVIEQMNEKNEDLQINAKN